MDEDEPATPCGLVAKSYFTDSYTGLTFNPGVGEEAIAIREDGIAWETDKMYKFKNVASYQKVGEAVVTRPDAWKDVQWLDMTNGKYFKIG